jgi:hypothetical protein
MRTISLVLVVHLFRGVKKHVFVIAIRYECSAQKSAREDKKTPSIRLPWIGVQTMAPESNSRQLDRPSLVDRVGVSADHLPTLTSTSRQVCPTIHNTLSNLQIERVHLLPQILYFCSKPISARDTLSEGDRKRERERERERKSEREKRKSEGVCN